MARTRTTRQARYEVQYNCGASPVTPIRSRHSAVQVQADHWATFSSLPELLGRHRHRGRLIWSTDPNREPCPSTHPYKLLEINYPCPPLKQGRGGA